MNYTQNEKIEQVTDSTMVVGVDIGSQIHYARAFDNRGRELTKRIFSFHNNLEGFNSFNLWAETLKTENKKTAVGTSVFIMAFTAFTGAASHFAIGGIPDVKVWILCILFTLIWARIAAVFANKATPKTLNRATGIILVVLGIVVMGFSFFS